MQSENPRRAPATPFVIRTFLAACAALFSSAVTPLALAQFGYNYGVQEPKFIEHPQSQTVEQGQTATFRVKLEALKDGYFYSIDEDARKPVFQWLKNGTRIAGATTDTLTIPNAQPTHAGAYQVVVNDKYPSQTATLTVIVPIPATILTQPMGATITAGQTVTFSVHAAGTPAPTYRWRKNGLPIPGATLATLTLTDVQESDAGNYDVLVTNSRNSILSRTVPLRVNAASDANATAHDATARSSSASATPAMTLQRGLGESAGFSFPAATSGHSYQWKRNGQPIAGATGTNLDISSVTAADMGFYSIVATLDGTSSETLVAMLVVTTSGTSRLANLSTRGWVPAGGALTPGFSLRGTGTARLLVRAIGPTLARFGVSEAHRDPTLEIVTAGASQPMLTNDNWSAAGNALEVHSTTAAVGAFALDTSARDAAVVAPFASDRNYTARISGRDSADAGIVLAEVYDPAGLDHPARLAAVSTLGPAGAGDRSLVSGFTIAGTGPKRLLIRAVGPALAAFGVTDALADPQLVLAPSGFDATLASNDNWQGDAALAATAQSAGAFALDPASRDAAIEVVLPPGGYTVTVSSRDGIAGTALVEIYDLDR
jgi:hypothetical protein